MFLKDATLIRQNAKGWYIISMLPTEIVLIGSVELPNMDVLKDRRVKKAVHITGRQGYVFQDSDGFKEIILSESQ